MNLMVLEANVVFDYLEMKTDLSSGWFQG